MAGSSSCFNSVAPEPLADLDITHYPSAVDDHGYVTEVGLNTTGEALDWLAQLFYDRAPRRDDFARIEHAAAAAAPGADGLLFAPMLGDGERDDPTLVLSSLTELDEQILRGLCSFASWALLRRCLPSSLRSSVQTAPRPFGSARLPPGRF